MPVTTKDGRCRWRMARPCADCPFSNSPAGKHLRESLRPGRMAGIKRALRADGHLHCHMTTRETGNGTDLLCAGALRWQRRMTGQYGQLARVCERLDYFKAERERRAT